MTTNTLAELFTKDPLQMTDQDLDRIIEYNRQTRAAYLAGQKSAGNPKKIKSEKKSAPVQLDLGDLDL